MHARLSTYQGSADDTRIDEAIKRGKEEILPQVRDLDGYLGVVFLVDRATGKSVSVTLWRDAAALKATESVANTIRDEGAEVDGDEIVSVERYEVGMFDVPSNASV